MNFTTEAALSPSTGMRYLRAVWKGPPPPCVSMSVTTGGESSSTPARSARRLSICDMRPAKQMRTRPRSCLAASRSSLSRAGCSVLLMRKSTGVFSGPASRILSAISGVRCMTMGVRLAEIHLSRAWMSSTSPSKMANRSSWGMNMTTEGTETWYLSRLAAEPFSSSQHLSCSICAQPPEGSSVLLTCSFGPLTAVAKASVHSLRCGFRGASLQCMPMRGRSISLVLLELVPTSTVSQMRLACVEMCWATCFEISVPLDSANITSSKWREDLPKTVLL
mmetsp:Transcript_41440/g.128845  ORF Transcript_41440/g.128845 Transcript_41440/m.128845 type:complete len:278 (-) Transcript_41440:526-1359(-)